MTTLFISDLHLDSSEPGITELFLKFLATKTQNARALYILGDFFEYWVGDDLQNSHNNKIIKALSECRARGLPIYFIPGNRDFLVDHKFAARAKI